MRASYSLLWVGCIFWFIGPPQAGCFDRSTYVHVMYGVTFES